MIKIAPRQALLALAVIAASCVIAACGSSSSSSSKSSSSSSPSAASSASGSTSARRTALLACLRAHGVNLPARPPGGFRPGTGGAGGAPGARPPGSGFFGGGANSKAAAAFRACGGGNFRGRRFNLSRSRITSYVACVRKNGYNLPNPNFSGTGPVFPANIRTNPKFQSASRKCQNLLAPPRGGTSSTASS